MEGHSIQEPVHVTVWMATVGLPVEVSVLHGAQQLIGNMCPGLFLERTISMCLSEWKLH